MMHAVYQWLHTPEGVWSFTRLFRYITLRTAYAAVTSGGLCWIMGWVLIPRFKRWKLTQRDPRRQLSFHESKRGTPTMGGVLIVGSVVLSSLLWADLSNRFVHIVLFVLMSFCLLGSLDDWKQIHSPENRGMRARTKFAVQAVVALLVVIWLIREPLPIRLLWRDEGFRFELAQHLFLPFLKSVWLPMGVFYVPFVMIVVMGSSNAVNLTDGLDGLAVGSVIFVAVAYGAMAYVSGHYEFSEYLQIPNVRGSGELVPVVASIIGAALGFLWYNAYPAEIFMGDAGSLPLGGSLGTIAVIIKQELLLALVGGVFVIEAVSVMLQVLSFKTTGKRVFKMAPLHHHFELSGWEECKITIRFWIIGIVLALLALSTLKLR